MSLEEIENQRKRLIFRSEHRGTKEMDLLLGSFARKHVPDFSEQELDEYEDFLKHNDPDLYNWITEKEEPPQDVASYKMFQKIKGYRYA